MFTHVSKTLLIPSPIFCISDGSLWFGQSLYESEKCHHSVSSRTALAFLDKHKKEEFVSHFGPHRAKYLGFGFLLSVFIVTI